MARKNVMEKREEKTVMAKFGGILTSSIMKYGLKCHEKCTKKREEKTLMAKF